MPRPRLWHTDRFGVARLAARANRPMPSRAGSSVWSTIARGGRSGYPKISGRVIQVLKISGFENRYPKLQRVLQYPKIRVPGISGLEILELYELLCQFHKNTCTLLN
jgi:hypothetical protein